MAERSQWESHATLVAATFSSNNVYVLATIYPDTNAFYMDPQLRKKYSKDFLAVLAPGVIEVHLSQVVLAETRRHTSEDARLAARDLRKVIGSIARRWQSPTADAATHTEALAMGIQAEGEKPLADLVNHPATTILGWPGVSARELVERELDGRRPTKLQGEQTVGLRDTVIWHTVLEDLDLADPGSIAILITNDAGFLSHDRTELHEDLLDDLEDAEIDADRVVVHRDLAGATLEAQKFARLIGDREAIIREEFLAFMRSLDRLDWFGHFDPRDGGWASAETSPAEAPRYIEEGQVIAVDVEDIESISDNDPFICVGYAVLTFEGSMLAYEFFSGEHDDVELYDGEMGDHFVSVTTWKRVRVEADVEVDMGKRRADVVGSRFEFV